MYSSKKSIEELPSEILIEIFLVIPHHSLQPLSQVNSTFHDLLTSNLFWKLKCQSNVQIISYFNQFKSQTSSSENLEVDWRMCFYEYLRNVTFCRMDVMKIGINPTFSSDGYRNICSKNLDSTSEETESETLEWGSNRASFVKGKYRVGKWYFELKIIKRTSAMSIGFCDPQLKLNVDSEYEDGFFGIYHGGVSKMFVSFESRVKRTIGDESGMKDGDHMGVFLDLDKRRSIGYFKKENKLRSGENGKKRVIRKVYYICEFDTDMRRMKRRLSSYSSAAISPKEKIGEEKDWFTKVFEGGEVEVSSVIWLDQGNDRIVFNDPMPVSQEFLDSFKISKEEDELFGDIKNLCNYEEDFFK